MSGFTKLFGTLVTSTIWREDDKTRIVWITMLALADRNGYVGASVPGLAAMANVSVAECVSALAKLEGPDQYSRTSANEGRRVVIDEGGWKLLNYPKYRELGRSIDRTEYLRIKQAEHRAKTGCQPVSTNVNQDQPISEAEGRSRRQKTDPEQILAPLGVPELPVEFLAIWDGTGKHGTREEALKAWKKRGKPSWASVSPVWAAYMLSERPVAGYVKDLSSWLNKGCHLQEWQPARAPPTAVRNGSAYQQTIESMQGFLERHQGED